MQYISDEVIASTPALKSLLERMKGLAPEEIERRLSSPQPGELDDEELALVGGGLHMPMWRCKCGLGPMLFSEWVVHWVRRHGD